jgi:hypothetical protein
MAWIRQQKKRETASHPPRLFSLLLGIAAFMLFADACQANAIPNCDGARVHIAVDIPFHDIPISISERSIGSDISTLASIVVTNTANSAISELDIQIEYRGSNDQVFGSLRFVASTGSPTGWLPTALPSWPKSALPLAPGGSISLDGTSLRIFAVCPDKARLTAIRLRFADGSEFIRTASPWTSSAVLRRGRDLSSPSEPFRRQIPRTCYNYRSARQVTCRTFSRLSPTLSPCRKW